MEDNSPWLGGRLEEGKLRRGECGWAEGGLRGVARWLTRGPSKGQKGRTSPALLPLPCCPQVQRERKVGGGRRG